MPPTIQIVAINPSLLDEIFSSIILDEFEDLTNEKLRTKQLKVWISYAKFEASTMADDYWGPDLPEYDVQASLREQKKQCLLRARRVFYTAKNYFRTSAPELREERAMLLEEWLNLESSFGKLGDVNMVRVKLPKKLKKRRLIETEDGPVGVFTFVLNELIA
ncbi:hypothetical protein LguiA_004774 [Lonicera macranthoides]